MSVQLFDLDTREVIAWQARQIATFGDPLPVQRRPPLGQLVKAMISARTRDAVSTAAYDALTARFRDGQSIADARPAEIVQIISAVTFAEDKAANLVRAMRQIGRQRPGFDLSLLAELPLSDALTWLERLPGVARKVSASTLNVSTLARPVLIVDTHVLRVLQRLRFVAPIADFRATSEAVTDAMPLWGGDDFLTLHILLKRLGQTICRWDVPACHNCPLAADCPTARLRRPGVNGA